MLVLVDVDGIADLDVVVGEEEEVNEDVGMPIRILFVGAAAAATAVDNDDGRCSSCSTSSRRRFPFILFVSLLPSFSPRSATLERPIAGS